MDLSVHGDYAGQHAGLPVRLDGYRFNQPQRFHRHSAKRLRRQPQPNPGAYQQCNIDYLTNPPDASGLAFETWRLVRQTSRRPGRGRPREFRERSARKRRLKTRRPLPMQQIAIFRPPKQVLPERRPRGADRLHRTSSGRASSQARSFPRTRLRHPGEPRRSRDGRVRRGSYEHDLHRCERAARNG